MNESVESQTPWVFKPERQCHTAGGVPKVGYDTFDEAHAVVLSIGTNQRKRVHVYRCVEHGWHVGTNPTPHLLPRAA